MIFFTPALPYRGAIVPFVSMGNNLGLGKGDCTSDVNVNRSTAVYVIYNIFASYYLPHLPVLVSLSD